MTERLQISGLELTEREAYEQLYNAGSAEETHNALLALGYTHLRMEPAMWRTAAEELWTAMHNQDVCTNLATIALVAGYIAGGAFDEASYEHADVLHTRKQSSPR